jgi:hypothetical protein
MEKRNIFVLTMCALIVLPAVSQGDTDWFSGTLNVQLGDNYDHTYIWNDAELDMSGGTLQSLDMLNSSTALLSGGNITEGVSVWNDSTMDITGGEIGWYLDASDLSTVNLHGGEITDWLYATDSSMVNIYGYGFNYDGDAGDWNGGLLTGFWFDDTPFSIDILDNIEVDSTYYDHVNLVPEPCTLSLLILGGLGLLRKRRMSK